MDIRVEDKNLIPYNDWLTGNTTIYNGTYTATNFGTVSQIVEYAEDPFGNTGIVWTHNTISPLSRNGFYTATVDVDINYNYRYSCWVKSSGETQAYFRLYGWVNGTQSGLTNITTGAFKTDPNFFQQIPYNYSDDEWYLWVGHVRSYNTTGTTNLNESGLYSTNGTKLVNFTDWKFLSNINGTSYRMYIPYNTSGTTVQFIYPRIDKCDGTEPSINTLLQNEGMWRSGTTYIKVEDQNLVDHSDWYTPITGNTANVGEYINVSSKNYIENDIGPHGIEVPIWKTQGFATGYTAGIGYTYTTIPTLGTIVDNTKMYRLSLWVNRKKIGTNGLFYFGYNVKVGANAGNSIRINDGVVHTNFYFVTQNFTQAATTLPENNWVLAVGYLLPSTYTGSTDANYYTRIYNTTSSGYLFAQNYKMSGNTTGVWLRCYTPYNETTWSGTTSWLYNPRIDLVDGTEPSIATLFSNEGMWRSGTTMIYVDDGWKNTT